MGVLAPEERHVCSPGRQPWERQSPKIFCLLRVPPPKAAERGASKKILGDCRSSAVTDPQLTVQKYTETFAI